MNLLAKRENEVPAELEKVFPGMEELMRSIFGRFIEPGSGLLRGSVFDARWETEVGEKEVTVRIPCPGFKGCDFELEIMGDFLNVKVRRCEAHKEVENKDSERTRRYLFRERCSAEYEESIKLPAPVRGAEAIAKYVDGILVVKAPRDLAAPVGSHTVKVSCGK